MRLRRSIVPFLRIFLSLICVSHAQPQVQKLIGGAGTDDGWVVVATPEGGCVIAGQTTSYGAGGTDVFVAKLSPAFTVEWARVLGGPGDDWAGKIVLLSDSAVLVAGYTSVPGYEWDGWLFKMDLNGSVLWSKRYGGSGSELLVDILPRSGGGFLVAGHGVSYGSGGYDIWLLRIDAEGTVLGTRTYGGGSTEAMNTFIPTSDGGCLIAGHTYSYGAGMHDIALLKVSSNLDLQWTRTYGTSVDETAYTVHESVGGGYVAVCGTHGGAFGGRDAMIMRVDSLGGLISAGSLGTTGEDQLVRSADLGPDGMVVGGWATAVNGLLDGWFIHVSDPGLLQQSVRCGGLASDRLIGAAKMGIGQLVFVGSSASGSALGTDAYVVRTSLGGMPLSGSAPGPDVVTPLVLSTGSPSLSVTSPSITAAAGPDSAISVSFTVADLFTPPPSTLRLSIPPVFSRAGDPVAIPVMLESPYGVAGADIAVQLDTSVVLVHGVRRGSLTGPFALAFNVSRPDSVLISLANGAGIQQSQTGSLVILDGTIRPGVPDSVTSPIHFTRADLYDPLSHALDVTVLDGVLKTGFGRKGDVNADLQVNAADAIIVLRMSAGIEFRNERDRWAADFDGNGIVTPYDAVGVLRTAVGLTTPLPGDTLPAIVRIHVAPVNASAGQVVEVPVRIEGMPELVSGSLDFGFGAGLVEVRALKNRDTFDGLLEMSNPTESQVKIVFASATAWGRTDGDLAAVEVQATSALSDYRPSFLGGWLTDRYGRSVNTFQFITTGVGESETVRSFALHPNHPNPFNPSTTIRFDVSRPSRVQIVVRNLLGQTVAELFDDVRPAGTYQVPWHAQVGTGVYFCTMQAVDAVTGEKLASFTQKMLLMK